MDFCGVLYDPDALRSGSSDAGFFGIPGDDVRGEAMDSGRGDRFATSWDPDTLLSSSNEAGFFGVSGVDLLNWPEEMRGDFAGGAGLSTRDCRGFLVTGSSSDVPLVLEGTELGRTCSGLTNGVAATSAVTFSGTVFSGSVAVCLAAGALRFGPRARPLVMCCSSGAGPVLVSAWTPRAGDSVPSALDVDLLVVRGGGPRASIPASAGLKRSASLLALAGSLDANEGAGCTGLSSVAGLMTRRLFFRARASGMELVGFSRGMGFDGLSARPRVPLLAIASGSGAGCNGASVFLRTEPSS
jgi:hypothetical protein